MAEIFGAVASGLAVAEVGLKVGGTVWKLNKLWQEVHEVPETIKELMRQIEFMDSILSDHENNLSIQTNPALRRLSNYNGMPAMLSSVHCQEALNDLRRLVEDLDGAVASEKRSRRTVARTRVVLKKDTLKEFHDRMERAAKLIQFSQLNFLTAKAITTGDLVADVLAAVSDIRVQQQVMAKQLSSIDLPSSSGRLPFPVITQPEETSQEHTMIKGRIARPLPWTKPTIFGSIVVTKTDKSSLREANYAARIQLPKWLFQTVWDIHVNRACSGWQGSFSTWNVVPYDSPGMRCAKGGDLDGLIDLFARGLASHRDCDMNGRTIFHVACLLRKVHIVKYLMDMKLDAINIGFQLADVAFMVRKSLHVTTGPVLQALASRGLFEAPEGILVAPWVHFLAMCQVHLEVFKFFFHELIPSWGDLRPKEKQDIIMAYGFISQWNVSTFRFVACPNGPIQDRDVQGWLDDGASLLHVILVRYFTYSWQKNTGQDWIELLREVIKATNSLHYLVRVRFPATQSIWPLTAFGSVLLQYKYDTMNFDHTRKGLTQVILGRLTRSLQSLMSLLANCGYDLLKFGQQEAAIWTDGNPADRIVGDAFYFGFNDECDGFEGGRLVSAVHYGADPMDWYFEMEDPYEDYAGAFWHLIEDPPLYIPGAWIDDE